MKNRKHSKKMQWIMGINAILEALRLNPSIVQEVYYIKSDTDQDDRRKEIFHIMEKEGITRYQKGKNTLLDITNSPHHQGFVAKILPENDLSLDDLLSKIPEDEPAFLFLIDSVGDPQNVGSLFRLAEGFGAKGLIWSKNRGCDLTPSVAKASSGASVIVPYARVSNLAQTLPILQDHGFFIAASAIAPDAKDAFKIDIPERLAIILGSEGEGVRSLLAKTADGKWVLPLKGNLQSMNVVQAACAFVTLWRNQWG